MSDTVLPVRGASPYDVVVGRGLGHHLPGMLGPAVEQVAVLCTERLEAFLDDLVADLGDIEVTVLSIPDGEEAKQAEVAAACWDALGELGFTRSDAVVTLGGGATTDLGGFVAATWLRGVRVVHVPTTLLGMVDAAVGGKTGINTPAGKNLVGAFHQPTGVVVDLDRLATLDDADLRSGLAEVVKAGFIADPDILDRIESGPDALLARDPDAIRDVVERAIRVKAGVVAADPRESGGREVLNYGHTLAHAIERHAGYGTWRHGEAVSVGLCFAASVARLVGTLDTATAQRHAEVLTALGLPTRYGGDWDEVRAAMSGDKKSRGSRLRLVVLEGLARPVLIDDPGEQLLAAAYQEVSA